MNKVRKIMLAPFLLAVVSACSQEPAPPICTNDDGFLITNITIHDGSGSPGVAGSVRVTGGLIAATGDLQACDGEPVVDGGGQVLAPGFIDTHSHADRQIFEYPDALPVVSQGITTIIAGQDGGSRYPLAEFFADFESTPATVNIASYVGHGTLRNQVMGDDFRRTATADEIAQMRAMLASELESGALGLGAGLEYEPGIHSETEEVLELARVAAEAGGRYISHVRSEDRWFEDAIDEIILIGRETGMPVQVSHIKLAMKRLWGSAAEIIAKLDAARAEGINITAASNRIRNTSARHAPRLPRFAKSMSLRRSRRSRRKRWRGKRNTAKAPNRSSARAWSRPTLTSCSPGRMPTSAPTAASSTCTRGPQGHSLECWDDTSGNRTSCRSRKPSAR